MAQWNLTHPEYRKEHHEANKEHDNAVNRAWAEFHKDELSMLGIIEYIENKEEISKKGAKQRRTPKARYSQSIRTAKARGLPFLLTYEEYSELIQRGCRYCCWDLPEAGSGLDRANNSKEIGYTLSNSVPCCKACNIAKNSIWSYEQMLIVGQAIQKVKDEEYIRTRVCYG